MNVREDLEGVVGKWRVSGQHVSWTYVKLSSKNTFNYNKSRATNKSCLKVRTTTRKSQKEVLDMPIKESDVLKKNSTCRTE